MGRSNRLSHAAVLFVASTSVAFGQAPSSSTDTAFTHTSLSGRPAALIRKQQPRPAVGGPGDGGSPPPPPQTVLDGTDVSSRLAFRSFDVSGAVGDVAANGINASGYIVGSYCTDASCFNSYGFELQNGFIPSKITFPGAPVTAAQGINDAGETVGFYWDPAFLSTHGAVFPSMPFDLCTGLVSQTRYWGISDSSWIAANCGDNGYLVTAIGAITYTIPPAQFLNTESVLLRGVNTFNQFVGYTIDTTSNLHGLIGDVLAGPNLIDYPGALSTQFVGINDAGEIVGDAWDSNGGHGVLCPLPLGPNCFQWFDAIIGGERASLTQPNGIGSNGEIVGQYQGSGGSHAFVAKPYSVSYYVKSTNPLTLFEMGRDTAVDQTASNDADRVVALLFGAPNEDAAGNFGATMWTRSSVSTQIIASLVECFVDGYYGALGSNRHAHLTIAISTSNRSLSKNYVTFDHGVAWASMVAKVAADVAQYGYSGQVAIAGGTDIEFDDETRANGSLAWAGPTLTKSWIDGFASVTPQHFLYYVGNLGGCNSSGTGVLTSCLGGWSEDQAWYAAWGPTPNKPMPQIYNVNGKDADRWHDLALYSMQVKQQRLYVSVSLTEAGDCQSAPDSTCGNSPSDGWQQLYDSLNNDPQTAQHIPFLSDITATGNQ